MPSEPTRVPWGRRLRHVLRTYRAVFSILVLAIGVFLTILGAGGLWLGSDWPFSVLNQYTVTSTANFNLVFISVGPIVALIGAYLVGAYYVARVKFEHLMVTKSKAEFLRNVPELEDLLWELTPDDEIRYENKRIELKIRR